MRLFALTLFFLGVCAFQPSASAQSKTTIVPTEWLPALHPSIQAALDRLKEADAQMEMNSLSREVAEMTDAQLFIAYVRLYQRLDTKARAKLVAEQVKWLKAREKAAKEGVESEGGSLAPLEANNAEVTFTEKRLAELRARLKAIKGEDAE
jgi:uncharacterized protein YecT (DUF1311 family)